MMAEAELALKEFSRLLNKSQSKDQIDQRSEECIKRFKGVYYRQTRRNLAYILFTVPSHMQQLLPFYGRFAATLNQYFSEVGSELVSLLMAEFDSI